MSTINRHFVCEFEITVDFLFLCRDCHIFLNLLHLVVLLLNKGSKSLNISSDHLCCKNLECNEFHDNMLVKTWKAAAEFS